MDREFADYEAWARNEAGIIFSKVKVSSVHQKEQGRQGERDDVQIDTNEQRGLYATDTIYPGERILLVPSNSLLGAEYLQQLGSRLLLLSSGVDDDENARLSGADDRAETTVQCDTSDDDAQCIDARLGEKFVVAAIEMLRRMLVREENAVDDDESSSNPVQEAAVAVDFEWRDDDAVAVYLACCRSLLADEAHNDTEWNKDDLADGSSVSLESANFSAEPMPSDHNDPPILTEAVLVTDGTKDDRVYDATSPDPPHISNHEPRGAVDSSFPSFLPHIAVLPDSFPTSPLYYSAAEMSRIDGTNCAEYASRMLQQFESDYSKLSSVLRAFDDYHQNHKAIKHLSGSSSHDCRVRLHKRVTFEAYKWALCNIYSRSSDFVAHSPSLDRNTTVRRRRVIAPLFDMMNHDFDSDITHSLDVEDHKNGDFSVFNGSNQVIEAGQEICLSYGNFPNEKLLLIYGFVVEHNPYDAVAIYAPFNPADPLYHAKCRLLQSQCRIDDSNEPHLLRHTVTLAQSTSVTSILPNSLLTVLRLIGVHSPDELLSIAFLDVGDEDGSEEDDDNASRGIGMISVENERSALLALQQALYAMSRQLALNLISDEGLLQGASPEQPPKTQSDKGSNSNTISSVNLTNARILCQSEYQILQFALTELHDRLFALEGNIGAQQ